MSWKEETVTEPKNDTRETVMDGVFREEMQRNTMTETDTARARMEDAVYGGNLHTEDSTVNRTATAAKKTKKKKNSFAVIVATGLIALS